MRFQCPKCGGIVAVDNSDVNTMVQCGHCSQIVQVPASRVSPGALIGDFIIQKELGRGGMGVVYLAHQISLDRPAALKVLSEQYANNAEFVVGFIKEARAAAKLNHPHIVQAYAVGEDDGIFYFAMENIDGETMKSVMKRQKIIPVDQAINIIQQIAEALNYAWIEQKLIHRDIKPDNIMLTSSGRAKLADLGLARVAGDIDDSEDDDIMGTPQYISPEHLTGAPMDGRSDIYSLGATFYHFVTGRFPFEGKTGAEIAQKHITDPLVPPKLVNPDVPECVSRIIEKMMEKNPVMRYQTAESLVDDLRIARKLIESEKPSAKAAESRPAAHKRNAAANVAVTGKHPAPASGHTMKRSGHGNPETTTDRLFNDESVTQAIKARKMRERKPFLLTLSVIFLLAAIGGGFLAYHYFGQNSSGGERGGAHDAAGKDRNLPPAVKTMRGILTFAGKNPKQVAEVHVRCEQFLKMYPGPGSVSGPEPETFAEFMALYSRSEESLIGNSKFRVEAAEALQKKIQARAQALEQAEQLRLERERQEKERKAKAEEERRRREQEARERKERAEEAKKDVAMSKPDWFEKILNSVGNRNADFNAAVKTTGEQIAAWEGKAAEFPYLSGIYQPDLTWMKKYLQLLRDCAEIQRNSLKPGDFFKDVMLPMGKGRPRVKVIKIDKGRLYYRAGATERIIKLNELTAEQRDELSFFAARKIGKENALYLYFLLTGSPERAAAEKEALSDSTDADLFLKEMHSAAKAILEDGTSRSRKKLHTVFGGSPQFRDLF